MAKRGNKNSTEDGLSGEINKFNYQMQQFNRILDETKKSLNGVAHLKLFPLETEVIEIMKTSGKRSLHKPAFVILGTARARTVNFLLNENLLPLSPSESSLKNNWRGLRLQFGTKRQYKISLGKEFEVIEPNLCVEPNSNEIPFKNLQRNNSLDLCAVLDIELCNPFLKNGIPILVPPDLNDLSFSNKENMQNYDSFYTKWNFILENIFPIIIYSLDEIHYPLGYDDEKRNAKSSNHTSDTKGKVTESSPSKNSKVSPNKNNISKSSTPSKQSTSTFYIERERDLNSEISDDDSSTESDYFSVSSEHINNQSIDEPENSQHNNESSHSDSDNSIIFNEENLLDLCQIYEFHPNAKVLFMLFSDSFPKPTTSKYRSLKVNSSLASTSKSSTNEKGELTKSKLLHMQKAFVTQIIQQLHMLLKPQANSSNLGLGIIVNDTQKTPSGVQKSSDHTDIKNKLKTFNSNKIYAISQRSDFMQYLVKYSKICFRSFILNDCNKLIEIHNTLLQQFIMSSFDMAREMQIIPKKIQYVAKMERKLYDKLHNKFSDEEKREELLSILQLVLQEMKQDINSIDWSQSGSSMHNSIECINLTLASSIFYTESSLDTGMSSKITESEISNSQDAVENIDLNDYCVIYNASPANSASPSSLFDALEANEDTVSPQTCISDCSKNPNFNIGLFNKPSPQDYRDTDLFKNANKELFMNSTSETSQISFRQASLDIQRAVLAKLSKNISIKLLKYVDFIRDSYFGTLQRCLESLEEGRCRRSASEAVKQILFATRTIDLQHCASFSFLHTLVDQLRRFFHRLSLLSNSNKSCCVQSPRWRRQVALDTLESLNATRLAKLISSQLKDKIKNSHEQFQSALHNLSEHHTMRLQQTEEIKLAVRKLHAPRFARLCLESTSLKDVVRFGIPRLGKEIGRGQYGIVFLTKGAWAGYEPCAVKSVVPPDERHFNELAMEFFHTRNMPKHDRIVQLWGSVIDYSFINGNPSVLLISERLKWDLHCALLIETMSFKQRMQITVDIVEGIRFLHSQGLVHRDIKLKNVLLDDNNRAKLTDLGFCIPEAMMSGSIVGTPIHMAPELLTGIYDNSVDVYAFGILLWYVCGGTVQLPAVFEQFQNKEQLWTCVQKGLRPERLPQFSDTCWSLMEKCWATNPVDRPLLGDVQPILESVRDNLQPILPNDLKKHFIFNMYD